MESAIYDIYSNQSGGYLPVFSGYRGGGFFGTLAKFALPVLKNLGKRALGVVTRGASEYLSGNKKLSTAMLDELGDEVDDLARVGIKQATNLGEAGIKRFNRYRKRVRCGGRSINKHKSRLD